MSVSLSMEANITNLQMGMIFFCYCCSLFLLKLYMHRFLKGQVVPGYVIKKLKT